MKGVGLSFPDFLLVRYRGCQLNDFIFRKSYAEWYKENSHDNKYRPRDYTFKEWMIVKVGHTNVNESIKKALLKSWVIDYFEEALDHDKDPRERSFDDYKWVFDLEIVQLANEYELGIKKKGHILDMIWENCKNIQGSNSKEATFETVSTRQAEVKWGIFEVSGRAEELEEIQDKDTSPSENTSEIPMEVKGFEPPQEEFVHVRRSARTHRAPERLRLNVEVVKHSFGDLNEPTNYKATMLDPESNKWLDVMNVEMQSMKDNQVWCLVDLPPKAKGFTQTYEVDYEEMFSPVADIRAIRIPIAIKASVAQRIPLEVQGRSHLSYFLSKDVVLLRVFPFTLTRSAKRWVDRLTPGVVNTWDLLKKAIIQRSISSSSNTDGLAAIISKLDNLGRDKKKLKENVHAIQVGCQICEGPHLDKEYPPNEEDKQLEEVKYGEFGRPAPFNGSNGAKFHVGPPGYYMRTDNRPPYGEKRPSLDELMNKYQEESA
ncbi:hypothetical protein Tco_0885776 [Tanacetum coccineum]